MPDNWPIPKFHFQVIIDGQSAFFTEVSGLDMDTEVIEYRDGNSRQFSPVKMPGMHKYGNVTLKRGLFKSDNKFFDWFREIKMNTIPRSTVTINLLDESGSIAMSWTLANAFPVRITASDLKSDGNEAAVESIELAYEGLAFSGK